MGFFDFARIEGFPTQYAENKTPVTEDVLEAGFIAAFIIILVSCFSILAGFKLPNGVSFFTRVLVSGFIGLTIMLGNFGQNWEVGCVHTKTPYKAGTKHEIEADIGLKIGLRSVNITLKADTSNELRDEIINYNERFEWTWDQGRFGFGPQSGLLQREFRAAQRRGLPLPILWIVDYLVVDGEGLRFGRFYRTAGWYAHIAMWSALPCWMLANLLFFSVAYYGAVLLGISGSFQLLACLLWASIRNSIDLIIPFENDEIKTKFGASFWLTFAGGILSLAVSLLVILLDLRCPDKTSEFFGINSIYDFKLLAEPIEESNHKSNDQEMALLRKENTNNKRYLIRERRSISSFAQKNFRSKQEILLEEDESENVAHNFYLSSDDTNPAQVSVVELPLKTRPVPKPPATSRPVPPTPTISRPIPPPPTATRPPPPPLPSVSETEPAIYLQ